MKTPKQTIIITLLIITCIFASKNICYADITVQSSKTVDITIIGYDGLQDIQIFSGNTKKGDKKKIKSGYQGLALLTFPGGQSYPLILHDKQLHLKIVNSSTPPSFPNSPENQYFYRRLTEKDTVTPKFEFANLMIQAKQLLESTYSINSLESLDSKKNEIHDFVGTHYGKLRYSDMVKRLIAQYFMMHEYVNYHTKGAPAGDFKKKYQKAVLSGVKNWVEILKPHIPDHEVINHIVSLYYNRSMVTLASQITSTFNGISYCPGTNKKKFSFPGSIKIINKNSSETITLKEIKGEKLFSFVSNDCPVSKVDTIIRARQLSKTVDKKLIVVPLEKLSDEHLVMRKMLSTQNMYFINDDEWRKNNVQQKIWLPYFFLLPDLK